MTSALVAPGTTYQYYTLASGTVTSCQQALVTSTCQSSNGLFQPLHPANERFATCAISSSTTGNPLDTLFAPGYPWVQEITNSPIDAQSDNLIIALSNRGGWGTGNNMSITFSFNILNVAANTPFYNVVDLPSEPHYAPDCDINFQFPLPIGGAIEEESGYTCTTNGDCHLTVIDSARGVLYESWRSNFANNTLQATCAIKWELNRAYEATLRGDQCTSSDAAGLPVTPLTFTPDEIASGSINHAIRFILPNSRIRNAYVRPATHGTNAATGGATGMPYGARLRLKANFDISGYSAGAQVILRAMKKYGIFLADGGTIPLTATTDQYTAHTWAQVGITANSLTNVRVTDFDVVNLGDRIPVTNDCVRTY